MSKENKYQYVVSLIEAVTKGEKDIIANLGNIVSILKYEMEIFWVGFYIVKENELVLGPFQGPSACTRIAIGRGVCGTSWQKKETVVVKNVHDFPGHIACNAASKSEIVVPVFDKSNLVTMVLDADSDELNYFDETDKKYLEQIAKFISILP
jgi:L-methionine (R)-S-oxide reductase